MLLVVQFYTNMYLGTLKPDWILFQIAHLKETEWTVLTLWYSYTSRYHALKVYLHNPYITIPGTYQACPRCAESYTVGPHIYHDIKFGFFNINGTFEPVMQLRTAIFVSRPLERIHLWCGVDIFLHVDTVCCFLKQMEITSLHLHKFMTKLLYISNPSPSAIRRSVVRYVAAY